VIELYFTLAVLLILVVAVWSRPKPCQAYTIIADRLPDDNTRPRTPEPRTKESVTQ